jgi:hypothetical protein
MTGEQCRKARERMGWTRLKLATAADVPHQRLRIGVLAVVSRRRGASRL